MAEDDDPVTDDPFRDAREGAGVLRCPFQGEDLPMVLRHADVRAVAKDWQTFSSDAAFRVPIPSEEDLRGMRQLPIELDPPEHGKFRAIVEPFFKRAKLPEVIEKVELLIGRLVDEALAADEIEAVSELALPLQSHALTYLLGVEESEAELWISWGIHVFHDSGVSLDDYLNKRFDQAAAEPDSDDFFATLLRAEVDGRRLTREEAMGFGNLTFAGGRDTIIHTVSTILAHFASHPEDLAKLRADPKSVTHAAEEFFRIATPLTHIGRVCPEETEVAGETVPADGRVSLCWISANRDAEVFDQPEEVRLDRKPNPHVAFGFGPHLCLGAPHARLLVKTLLRELAERVGKIEVVESVPLVEKQQRYQRANGYHSLTLRFEGR